LSLCLLASGSGSTFTRSVEHPHCGSNSVLGLSSSACPFLFSLCLSIYIALCISLSLILSPSLGDNPVRHGILTPQLINLMEISSFGWEWCAPCSVRERERESERERERKRERERVKERERERERERGRERGR